MGQGVNSKQPPKGSVHLSVVSHEQDDLVVQFLESVADHCQVERLAVTVTRNTTTPSDCTFQHYPFPVTVLDNASPKGFGANHNQAFTGCRQEYFCVVNPDILLTSDLFDILIPCFFEKKIGIAAPLLVDSEGSLQDSARKYPSPGRILRRIVSATSQEYDYATASDLLFPDWVAGMFMLFPAHVYQMIGGFDEAYFMYCEDADICMRLRRKGYMTALFPQARAIHNPRRASHRTLQHLHWHITSLLRFFCRYPFYTL